ncbi:odv-e18 [Malacosoma neustria nucleopolyhedrovirus]|jgi:hypothetical protein|uniref:odv-e18 n=1 Tax=Malacosoma neustria nuclear polyhedrosis virus TaxID=38012 RepID=UPI000E35C62E|nr:odv-e18 [Malacosoma neustria nucleopolyhedrovirus]AUF81542.1 odv-e18 [Malacosoma neustria nucleopolyhedrovirus]
MEELRAPTAPSTFSSISFNQSTLMTILIALVIIILLVMLFQSSSGGGTNSSAPAPQTTPMTFTNPLNATMRNNPFVNTAQRTML